MTRYHIDFIDDRGAFKSSALAESVGGNLRSTTRRYDGRHDLALIDMPAGADCACLESLLDADENVSYYRTTEHDE